VALRGRLIIGHISNFGVSAQSGLVHVLGLDPCSGSISPVFALWR
jgi:hypothetical protein